MTSFSPLRISVRTQSGQPLGQVVDVTVEPDTQSVIAYHVKPSRLMPDMVRSALVISRTQVITLSATEMVVDDAVTKIKAPTPAPQPTA